MHFLFMDVFQRNVDPIWTKKFEEVFYVDSTLALITIVQTKIRHIGRFHFENMQSAVQWM